ncbi:UbiD family decarboxylase, partial [Streptomyces sp. SP18CM02]
FPRFTRDTARPEGGGRAASGDAPAPARQWPLLTVLCAAGLGLLIVVVDSDCDVHDLHEVAWRALGNTDYARDLTVTSLTLVHGADEVRLHLVTGAGAGTPVTHGGWAVAGTQTLAGPAA